MHPIFYSLPVGVGLLVHCTRRVNGESKGLTELVQEQRQLLSERIGHVMLKVLINEDNLGVSRGANYSDLVHNRVKESDCCDLASVVHGRASLVPQSP